MATFSVKLEKNIQRKTYEIRMNPEHAESESVPGDNHAIHTYFQSDLAAGHV